MTKLVTDDMIEAAIQYLAVSSDIIAASRGMRLRAEYNRKRVRAKLILQSAQTSATMREAWAEAHNDYEGACEAEAIAVEKDEYHRNERNKADVIIEVWRTQSATHRAGINFK